MTDAFDTGVRDGMAKTAAAPKGRTAGQVLDWALRQPELHGAAAGAVLGWAAGPADDRWSGARSGAVIGAGVGHLKRLRRAPGGVSAVGGPGGTPAGFGAHFVGGTP